MTNKEQIDYTNATITQKDFAEPVNEDLEEAADAYNEEYSKYLYGLNTAFKAGANWQKEQMMKDAVDIYVCANLDKTRKIPCSTEWGGRIPWSGIFKNCNVGDRAKLIIIKED